MAIQSINPATDEVIDTFPETSPEELERMLAGGHAAFLDWRARPFAERSARMHEAARLLRERKDALARTMTLEMGKPIVQSEAEVDKCAGTCDYYAEHAERFLAVQPRETDATKSYVRFDPLGIILAVMPWNFPFWQVFRFAAPALMAGNAGLLKHASNVPQCALAIEDIFKAAGFPRGLFRTALIGSSAVGGLDRGCAGRRGHADRQRARGQPGRRAGGARDQEDRARARRERPLHRARRRRSGPGREGRRRCPAHQQRPELHLGEALHRRRARARGVHQALRRRARRPPHGRSARARHRCRAPGAARPPRRAASPGRGIGQARGPTRPRRRDPARPRRLLPADLARGGRAGHAGLRRGNLRARRRTSSGPRTKARPCSSPTTRSFGLGASLWTSDRPRAERLAAEIEAGAVFVNGLVKSDPRLPFGGIKRSGYGRELSEYGIREFMNVKSVWIK